MAPWLQMWPVPPQWCATLCQDIIASPWISCTWNNTDDPIVTCWQMIHFLTYHQALCDLAHLALSCCLMYLACNWMRCWRTAFKSTEIAFLVVRLLPWSISAGEGIPSAMGVALKPVRASWKLLPVDVAFSMSLFTVWICLSMKPLL